MARGNCAEWRRHAKIKLRWRACEKFFDVRARPLETRDETCAGVGCAEFFLPWFLPRDASAVRFREIRRKNSGREHRLRRNCHSAKSGNGICARDGADARGIPQSETERGQRDCAHL